MAPRCAATSAGAMKITKAEEQGLRLAIGLAREKGRATLSDLAHSEQMSIALTAKILAKLRRGGLIRAIRGRHGHYELAQQPGEVSVASVLRALDSEVVRGCFNSRPCGDAATCPHGADCGLRPMWRHIETQVAQVLGRISLADLLEEEGLVRQQVVSLWPRTALGEPAEREPAR
jgi:Rrf2 family transcriptional regulator, iron-sulfur cluster assembly transcription factor